MKSLTLLCLICALNLDVAQKLLRKAKKCSRLPELKTVSPNAKSSLKVAEHNQNRPMSTLHCTVSHLESRHSLLV